MGRWLSRLKNQKGPDPHPREPRQPPELESREGSLGFQGCPLTPFQNLEGVRAEPANDPAAVVADPDRCCWPHSTAMNTREIDTFMARVARFTDRGVSYDVAERIAEKLVIRDREGDDRRLCLECSHLQGSWRCGNHVRAGVGRDLPLELVLMLQRCPGLQGARP